MALADHANAETQFQQAIAISVGGDTSIRHARAYRGIAETKAPLGDYVAALTLTTQAIAAHGEHEAPDGREHAALDAIRARFRGGAIWVAPPHCNDAQYR
ncbi:MAG: hypothetical protein AAFX44_05125 [Pseudomonadota bacterium]